MNILVFGKNGQVASAFAKLAPNYSEYQVTCVGHEECDITDEFQVTETIAKIQPDLIVNTAAYTAVDMAEDDVEAAFLLNETAVSHIAKASDVPVVHFSTDYVFNGEARAPYEVDADVAPLGVYGQSKWAGEEALRAHCDKHIILRTAWVYSPWGGNFVKTMLRLMTERDQISVVNDQVGCPTSAVDLARAVLKIAPKLAEKSFDGFGTYHLVSETELSWHGFAWEVLRQAFLDCEIAPIPTEAYPTKATRPAYSVLSVKKFKETFGFGLPDWQSSLSRCLRDLGR
ncbi:dTDP-4-dehydrorhamnose reductase [Terasakiella sp. A23]|uniref:dTDP-4-dehydrorhamnose reductase n=1 Tax=Terasakiella sp. FCG-A23 TaxID=3080561 RepID=UPI002953A414|nr:dTDP-4-dehydrorhamnose reductase [Terasakiella sp. A23]MDV7341704.1 dTDP-4-dehydrorhamnose reductase [Terasakiella sp. A23]